MGGATWNSENYDVQQCLELILMRILEGVGGTEVKNSIDR